MMQFIITIILCSYDSVSIGFLYFTSVDSNLQVRIIQIMALQNNLDLFFGRKFSFP